MNLHSLIQSLRRALVPAALILLLVITLARAARPTAAGQEMSEDVAGASSPANGAPRLVGPRAFFQSAVPTPTRTQTPFPTPITPTDTPTPIVPTDTPTPIPPTDTPTPIPPTFTPTPVPPTFTPTPVPLPVEVGGLAVVPHDGVIPLDTQISFTAAFTDPNIGISIAEWFWGDNSTTVHNDVSSPAQASHAYSAAGLYRVVLTVTSSNGQDDSSSYEYVVVYDPSGGFVTGGGWIDSPAGAYVDDPFLTGKATFAFVSKYAKGKQVPTGSTQFRFKIANLIFNSDQYDWLVVTGDDRAIFSGEGTINGLRAPQGQPYKFKIWATDGQPDTFRIRIWWELADGTENDVYDNGNDQPINGGSIVVHKVKGK